MYATLGTRVQQLRTHAGLSLRALAKRVHVSHTYLWELERGRTTPDRRILAGLDEALCADGELVALLDQPDSRLAVESHKFIPAFIGVAAAQDLASRNGFTRSNVGGLQCCGTSLSHPGGGSHLYVFACGVAVVHLREQRWPAALTELAAWRYRSYTTDLPWVTTRLAELLGRGSGRWRPPEYVLSLYWLGACAWTEPYRDTALRLICAPSVLVDRRDSADPQPLGRQVERSLLGEGFTHPDMAPFGVQGVSLGYAAWSGVAYHPLAAERALAVSELVNLELVVQMLWCYCHHLQRIVEDGRDPQVPSEYGWRFLRAARSRLTAARPQETTQHLLMREAVVRTSGIVPKLEAAQEALRETAPAAPVLQGMPR